MSVLHSISTFWSVFCLKHLNSIDWQTKYYMLKTIYLKPYNLLLCVCDVIKQIRRPSWKYMHANLARLIHNKISNNSFTNLSPSNFTKIQIISTSSGEAAFQWYNRNVTSLIYCLDSFQSKFMISDSELDQ